MVYWSGSKWGVAGWFWWRRDNNWAPNFYGVWPVAAKKRERTGEEKRAWGREEKDKK